MLVVHIQGACTDGEGFYHFAVLCHHQLSASAADVHEKTVGVLRHGTGSSDKVQLCLTLAGKHIYLNTSTACDFLNGLLAVVRITESSCGEGISLNVKLLEKNLELMKNLAGLVNTLRGHAAVKHIGCQSSGDFLIKNDVGFASLFFVDVKVHGV